MATAMEDPVYQRLMKALSGIVDSLHGEQKAYESFLDLLIRNEWVIKAHQGEQAIDGLRSGLLEYIELLESVAVQAQVHMDSVLDGAGTEFLCDRMEEFAHVLKAKQALQVTVGEGVHAHLSSLPPTWDDKTTEDE